MARSKRAVLSSAVVAPPVAGSPRALQEAFGGGTVGTRRLALQMAGLDPTGALPAAGTRERKSYLAARRSIERWNAGTRRPSARSQAKLDEARTAARAQATKDRLRRMRRRGVRVRMRAKITVSNDTRWRTIPAPPAPGLLLSSAASGDVVDAYDAGRFAGGADTLEEATLAAWAKGDAASFTIDEVEWVRAWPDGEDEPE